MKDIPIIFSGPMVRALLDGRKTMTRRLAWRSKALKRGPNKFGQDEDEVIAHHITPSPWQKVKPGDRLWVRESWRADSPDDPEYALYMADKHDNLPPGFKWRPSIHMPRWASRLTLTVTATKIERLQDISEADARAEGMPVDHNGKHYEPPAPDIDSWQGYGRASFALLWSGLHGKESWDANPDVVALTFTVAQQNIDKGERHD